MKKKIAKEKKVKKVDEVAKPEKLEEYKEPKVLGKPGWVDNLVWGKLTDEQKQRLIDGESLGEILK